MNEDTLELQREIVNVLQAEGYDVESTEAESWSEDGDTYGRIRVEISYDREEGEDGTNPFRVK